MLAAASSLAPRNRRWRLSRRLVVERVRGVGDGESHAMRLCTSDVTPVITRPGLETGRCQMVATVVQLTPFRRHYYRQLARIHDPPGIISVISPHFGGPCCGWRLRRVFRSGRSLYNSRYRTPRATNRMRRRRVWRRLSGCLVRTSLLGPWSGRCGTDKTDTQPSASSPPTRRRLTTTPSAHVTTPKALTTTPSARVPSTDRRASSHAARGSSRPF
jgi:hypothetical protein